MASESKKFLILHASAGHGHLKAAEAIAGAIRFQNPGALVLVKDALDFFPKPVKKQYVASYLYTITKLPKMWGLTYAVSDNRYLYPVTRILRRIFNGLCGRELENLMQAERWDAVISTHFMPAEVSAHLKRQGKLKGKAVTVVTDFLVHRFWLAKETDLYCGMCDETRAALEREGIDPSRIRITGIPVADIFGKREHAAAMRAHLGLDPDRFTVLFTSGGMGASAIQAPVAEFCRRTPDGQAVVVCGNNPALKSALDARAKEFPNLRVLGFVNNMHELMSAADLVVGKAGGSTTCETLAKGVPMMILEPVPGQEAFNRDILLKRGAALEAKSLAEVPDAIDAFRTDAAKRESIRAAIQAVGKPDAAHDVARLVLA